MALPTVSNKYAITIGVAVLVVLASLPTIYYFRQYQKAQFKLNNPTEAAKLDAMDTVAAVSRLMVLPEGEEPTVMQVSDVSKLQDQLFFANAQNGDKVLIYTQAKKAILYRSATNKIIDVAPINIGSATPSAQGSPVPEASPSAAPTSSPTPVKSVTPSATPT